MNNPFDSLGQRGGMRAEGRVHLGGEACGPLSAPRPGAARSDEAQISHLLELIARGKCQKVTSNSRCWDDPGSTPDCPWQADRWCDSCIAQAALDALNRSTSSTLVSSPGAEAASGGASRGDATAPPDVPNFP